MLYPQALKRGGWKKKLMLALGHRKDISGAACVHVTCGKEMEYCRDMGFSEPRGRHPQSGADSGISCGYQAPRARGLPGRIPGNDSIPSKIWRP